MSVISDSYLDRIEGFSTIEQGGKIVVDCFPSLIGIDPDLLLRGDLNMITVIVHFTASNGAATYRVIAQEGGLLIAERGEYEVTDV